MLKKWGWGWRRRVHMWEKSTGRTKRVNSEENEASYQSLNEHFYVPGITLRTLHRCELFSFTQEPYEVGIILVFRWGKWGSRLGIKSKLINDFFKSIFLNLKPSQECDNSIFSRVCLPSSRAIVEVFSFYMEAHPNILIKTILTSTMLGNTK